MIGLSRLLFLLGAILQFYTNSAAVIDYHTMPRRNVLTLTSRTSPDAPKRYKQQNEAITPTNTFDMFDYSTQFTVSCIRLLQNTRFSRFCFGNEIYSAKNRSSICSTLSWLVSSMDVWSSTTRPQIHTERKKKVNETERCSPLIENCRVRMKKKLLLLFFFSNIIFICSMVFVTDYIRQFQKEN